MTNPYKDLCNKEHDHLDSLKNDLNTNFFPECEFIFQSEYIEGCSKYSWDSYLILQYFGEFYKITLESQGNGGWLDIDECKVVSVYKVQKTVKVIQQTITTWDKI